MTRVARLVLLALALAGCGGDSASERPTTTAADDTLSFSLAGGLGPATSVSLDKPRGVLLYRYEWAVRKRVETADVRPTTDQWKRFWAEVDRVGVWQWRSSYRRNPVPPDGATWDLELAHDGRRIRSGGVGATPDRFGELVEALSALVGGRDL